MAYDFLRDNMSVNAQDDFRGAVFVHPENADKCATYDTVGGVCGWHGFVGRTCLLEVMVVDKRVVTRATIREVLRFPFEICGCTSILTYIDSTNAASISLATRIGFEFMSRIPGGGLNGDLLLYRLGKENCRWLRKVH